MRQVLTPEYDQILMLPPCVEDWVGLDHPSRFVREFVAGLDLRALKLDTVNREEGGTAYAPAMLVGAWLLGYLRKIRSTRALERACREEMGFVWLTGNHRPDHNALWRFWSAHRERVHELFRKSVKVALELQLVGLVVQALDGTKIMAACSGRGGYNGERLEKLLTQLDAEVKAREAEIAMAGNEPSETLPAQLQQTAQLRDQVRAALARVQAGEVKHAHPLEPEAARMECEGRNRFSYNAQAVVDSQTQIVVAAEVTAAPADQQQLVPMIAAAQATCEPTAATPITLADGGYATIAQLSAAQAAGYEVLTPLPSGWKDTSHPFHSAHFRYNDERKIVVCPQGRELPLARMRQRAGRLIEVYRSAKVCRDCPVRAQCTTDRHGRTIDIAPGQAALVALHERWKKPATTEFYGLRAPVVEPVFAQIKQQMGFRRWTVRGLKNVRAQWHLLCTAWNLQVIYKYWRRGASGAEDGTGFNAGGPDRPKTPRGRVPVSRAGARRGTGLFASLFTETLRSSHRLCAA